MLLTGRAFAAPGDVTYVATCAVALQDLKGRDSLCTYACMQVCMYVRTHVRTYVRTYVRTGNGMSAIGDWRRHERKMKRMEMRKRKMKSKRKAIF